SATRVRRRCRIPRFLSFPRGRAASACRRLVIAPREVICEKRGLVNRSERMRSVASAFGAANGSGGAALRTVVTCSFAVLFGCTLLPVLDAIELPASFQGTMPCAECEGIEMTLSLRDDGLYFLRQRYVGAAIPHSSVELGQWRFTEGKRRVVLEGKTRATFAALTPAQLQTSDQAHHLDR